LVLIDNTIKLLVQEAALKWLRALEWLLELIVGLRIFSEILLLKLSGFHGTDALQKRFVLDH